MGNSSSSLEQHIYMKMCISVYQMYTQACWVLVFEDGGQQAQSHIMHY